MTFGANLQPDDQYWMRLALSVSKQALGRTAENPPVGCIILDKDGQLVGQGYTAVSGRPHAETQALAMAGLAAKDGTAYVTLEPCAHTGKTPPCAEALIDAGIKRCVIASLDPDPRVNGMGSARLQAAGIDVTTGILQTQAESVLSGFFHRIVHERPHITMKIAISADGYISAAAGQQTWLTGEMAKRWVYDLRSRHDAILTGSGTAITDNPLLTCRAPLSPVDSPQRIILDSKLTLPLNSHLVQSAKDVPLLMVVTGAVSEAETAPYIEKAVEFLPSPSTDGQIKLPVFFETLAKRGINNLMIEAGSRLNASLLKTGLVDEVMVLQAPIHIGSGGLPAVAGADGLESVLEKRYIETRSCRLGSDRLVSWRLK